MNKKILVFTAIGTECVALVTIFVLIGRWLDAKYGWGGKGAAFGAILGVSAWILHLVVLLKQLAKDEESEGGGQDT